MVTAGANQAFVNIVLTLVDESDRVVLFKPYYFNHIMALQMTGGAQQVGEHQHVTENTSLAWLQHNLTHFPGTCQPQALSACTGVASSLQAALQQQITNCSSKQHAAVFMVPGPGTQSLFY